jgi:hypothetical protein
VPLPDGILSGRGQDVRAADQAQILDDSILADQSLKNHRSLHLHLPRQQRIAGIHRVVTISEVSTDICTCSAALLVTWRGGLGVAGNLGIRSGLRTACLVANPRAPNCCPAGWCDEYRRRRLPHPEEVTRFARWTARPVQARPVQLEEFAQRQTCPETRDGALALPLFLPMRPVWRLLWPTLPEQFWPRECFRPSGLMLLPADRRTRSRDHARVRCLEPARADRANPPSSGVVWGLRARVFQVLAAEYDPLSG